MLRILHYAKRDVISKKLLMQNRSLFCSTAVALLLLSVIFYACGGRKEPDHIIGRYKIFRTIYGEIMLNELHKQFQDNSNGSGVEVPPSVVGVGNNEDFIIVRQHPVNREPGSYMPDTTITNYYIVDMNNEYRNYLEMNIGPLTKNEFDSLRSIFKIESIPFDRNYPAYRKVKIAD